MITLATLFFLVTGAPNYENNVGKYDYRDYIESVNIIPGCSEFVYDTEPAYNADKKIANKKRQSAEKTDVLYALDHMQAQYKNLKNINLVVGWFGDTINSKRIKIAPRVEDKTLFEKDSWSVGDLKRKNVKRVSKAKNGLDNWGGTVSDRSVINLVMELKRRNYNVTLYPMLFIDVKGQPWRGYIKPKNDAEIDHFFSEYNKFIMHYANLEYKGIRLKDHLSGFIIGTELIGFTKNMYGIKQFSNLAAQVRNSLGTGVKITYAANWDEYHGDWEKGDKYIDWLWMDKNIDYIGIDAYFPLTDNLEQKNITKDMLVKGWESGVFYDYEPDKKQKLKPDYAIKNIEYWWKNEHFDKSGQKTPWVPKAKPIIFTEFGFYPTDGTSNEPSAFYDPMCADSHYPPKSTGKYDINAQSMGLLASEEFWRAKTAISGNEGLAFQRYVWAFDVSPPERKKTKKKKKNIETTNHQEGDYSIY